VRQGLVGDTGKRLATEHEEVEIRAVADVEHLEVVVPARQVHLQQRVVRLEQELAAIAGGMRVEELIAFEVGQAVGHF